MGDVFGRNAGIAFVQAKPELKSGSKSRGICGHKAADFSSKLTEGAPCQHPTPFLRQQALHQELGGWREKNGSIKL